MSWYRWSVGRNGRLGKWVETNGTNSSWLIYTSNLNHELICWFIVIKDSCRWLAVGTKRAEAKHNSASSCELENWSFWSWYVYSLPLQVVCRAISRWFHRLDHLGNVSRPEEALLVLIRRSDLSPSPLTSSFIFKFWVNLCTQHLRPSFINDWNRGLPQNSLNFSSENWVY